MPDETIPNTVQPRQRPTTTGASRDRAEATASGDGPCAHTATESESMPALSTPALAVLARLAEDDLYPYKLHQRMPRHPDGRSTVPVGTLYNTVAALARDRMISAVGTSRGGHRPHRTTYTITARGLSALREGLKQTLAQQDHELPSFVCALAEVHHLQRGELTDALTSRLGQLREQLHAVEARRAAMLTRDEPRTAHIHLDYRRTLLETEIRWLQHTARENGTQS